ncbi:hypothetical protein [Mucisphaera sp.]|uniref:hypothetical protein n=1 Tax=Mucisphaera sp. TaxID=2913024 RepID=UPI003D104DF5
MTRLTPALLTTLALTSSAHAAFTITLNSDDFTTTPSFSDVQTFQIEIVVDARLEANRLYVNPTLQRVTYLVEGTLEPGTPSGLPAFRLERNITGEEFYAQGSSFSMRIGSADLTDGLLFDELTRTGGQRGNWGPHLRFDAREFNTGRFHPPIISFRAGSGTIHNADNTPVYIDSGNPNNISLDAGDEYSTNLTFDPSAITIAIPEPTTAALLSLTSLALIRRRA